MACRRGVMVCYMFYFEGRCPASHSRFTNIFNADFFNTYGAHKKAEEGNYKAGQIFLGPL